MESDAHAAHELGGRYDVKSLVGQTRGGADDRRLRVGLAATGSGNRYSLGALALLVLR